MCGYHEICHHADNRVTRAEAADAAKVLFECAQNKAKPADACQVLASPLVSGCRIWTHTSERSSRQFAESRVKQILPWNLPSPHGCSDVNASTGNDGPGVHPPSGEVLGYVP